MNHAILAFAGVIMFMLVSMVYRARDAQIADLIDDAWQAFHEGDDDRARACFREVDRLEDMTLIGWLLDGGTE